MCVSEESNAREIGAPGTDARECERRRECLELHPRLESNSTVYQGS